MYPRASVGSNTPGIGPYAFTTVKPLKPSKPFAISSSYFGNPPVKVQLLSCLSGDVSAHVPAVRLGKERGIAYLLDHLNPFHLRFTRRLDRVNVLLIDFRDGVDDPVALHFDAGRTVRECSGALCSVEDCVRVSSDGARRVQKHPYRTCSGIQHK
jgi:hypothetical protein